MAVVLMTSYNPNHSEVTHAVLDDLIHAIEGAAEDEQHLMQTSPDRFSTSSAELRT